MNSNRNKQERKKDQQKKLDSMSLVVEIDNRSVHLQKNFKSDVSLLLN